MSTVNRPNRDALNRAIDIFRDAMRPFLVRTLRTVKGARVEEIISNSLNFRQADQFGHDLRKYNNVEAALDIGFFPYLISRNWSGIDRVFARDKGIQSKLHLIVDARNTVSHPGREDVDSHWTQARLSLIAEALQIINAPDEMRQVEAIRDALLPKPEPMPFDSPPSEESSRSKRAGPRRSSNLKSWREVIPPNQNVTQGTLFEHEFAADLQQVHDGRADATLYGNPVTFFNGTYITPGLRGLLVNALKRINGRGGAPVVQTKTGFGGGKTHSLIALYHVVNNADSIFASLNNPPPRVITLT